MYLALARMAFQRQLTYRAATLAGFATNTFFGALRAAILLALFAARGDAEVAGYSVAAAVTYTGLTQALIGFIALWGWWDVVNNIRTGDIASDLARPMDFFLYWCAQDAGRAVAQLILRGIPMVLLYALVYPVVWPPTLWHWLALNVAMTFSWLLSFTWRFLYSLLAFWMQDAIGAGRFATFMATFLSGFLMPVAFMPAWMVTLMRLTPFPSIINTPIEIYLGIVSAPQLLDVLAEQLVWVIVLITLARLMLAAGVKKLVIQGG
jgi:ABC-2 type transport system permease protein